MNKLDPLEDTSFAHNPAYGVSIGFVWRGGPSGGELKWDWSFCNPKDQFNKAIARKIILGRIRKHARYSTRMTFEQWRAVRDGIRRLFFDVTSNERLPLEVERWKKSGIDASTDTIRKRINMVIKTIKLPDPK